MKHGHEPAEHFFRRDKNAGAGRPLDVVTKVRSDVDL